jgi:hypothetical protein
VGLIRPASRGITDLVHGLRREDLNLSPEGTVKTVRSTVISHCGARSYMDIERSRPGHNPYYDFARETRGGSGGIVGPKVV